MMGDAEDRLGGMGGAVTLVPWRLVLVGEKLMTLSGLLKSQLGTCRTTQ